MKINKTIMTIILALSLILSGCDNGDGTTATSAFIGGTRGLDMKFTESQPPEKVMDDHQDTFGIAITLENVGEATILKDKVIGTLSGIDANAFGLATITATNQNEIGGKEKQNGETISGSTEIIDFGDASYGPKLTGDFETTIKADICYDYETQAVFSVCLKKNTVQKESSKETCKVEESKHVENSGAPVQISNVRESAAGNSKIKFSFDIYGDNVGKIYKQDTITAATGCVENTVTDEGKNKIGVVVDSQPGIIVSCSRLNGGSQGQVQMYDGKSTVVCEVDTSNLQDTAYNSQMTLKVKYTYKDSVEKQLVVKKS